MKKQNFLTTLILVATLLCAIFVLSACGNQENPDTKNCEHEWETIETISEASCISDGLISRKCTKCKTTEDAVVKALGHLLSSAPVSVVSASCTTSGCETYVCDRCGSNEEIEIDALGHLYNPEDVEISPATCTASGSETYTCSRCGEHESKDIDSLGHSCDDSYKCDVCGYLNESMAFLTFTLNEDNNSYSVSKCNREATEVVIPSKYNSKPVTSIKNSAFSACSNLISIYIPNTIESIGQQAFSNCGALKSVHLSSLKQWCGLDFSSTNSSYNVSYGSNPLSNGANLYIDEKLIVDLVIPDGTLEIGAFCFDGCSTIQSISIPESVLSIGRYAFRNCTNVNSIYYNAKNCYQNETFALYSTGATVFNSVGRNTEGVVLTIGNKVVSIPGSMFYGVSLYQPSSGGKSSAPKITDVVFEDNSVCETISSYAFACCGDMVSISLPDSLLTIETDAFMYCDKLETVLMSENIQHIAYDAFEKCTSLKFTSLDGIDYIGNSRNPYIVAFKASDGDTSTEVSLNENCKMYMDGIFSGIKTIHFSGTIYDWVQISFASAGSSPVKTAENIFINGQSIKDIKSIDLTSFEGNLGTYSLSNWDWLEKIILPSQLEVIPEGFFYNCDSLTNITLPSSLVKIEKEAFYDCDSITNVIFPEGLKEIIWGAFQSCENLKQVEIPNSVSVLEEWTFSHCTSLEFVKIGSGVSRLEYVFQSSQNIKQIVLDKSVTEIDTLCFSGCSSIEFIFYTGTAEDWQKVTVGGSNGSFTSSKVHYYSENAPTSQGKYWHYVDGVPTAWTN